MLDLPQLTVWTMVWNDDKKYLHKCGQVLRYCEQIINCPRLLFYAGKLGGSDYPWQTVQIPKLDWQGYNMFINRVIPQHIKTDFAMSVHEDGFPIRPDLWTNDFLKYDYIGAPWDDLVVGNGGFSIESQRMFSVKSNMPLTSDDFSVPSDRLICTTRRAWLEERGIRFAPLDLALQFSTEQIHNDRASFGFHGRRLSPQKYAEGWNTIQNYRTMQAATRRDGFTVVRNKIVPPPRKPPPVKVVPVPAEPIKIGPRKICIATTFDHNYAQAGETMMKSVRRHTSCDGIDFRIITDDPLVVNQFGAANCHFVTPEIKARYANVKYSPELPKERYHTSWYRYEIFSFEGYDRVICIDSDCLCLEDISYLFSPELDAFDLISVEDHIVSKCFTKYVPYLESKGLRFEGLKQRMRKRLIDVQPALLVANRSIVNRAWYSRLLQFANTSGFTYSIDEGILNEFIYNEGLKIKLLPLEWDYQDLYEIHCPTLPVPERPIIVHCQESKPFAKDKQSLDARMHKWHDRWHQEKVAV